MLKGWNVFQKRSSEKLYTKTATSWATLVNPFTSHSVYWMDVVFLLRTTDTPLSSELVSLFRRGGSLKRAFIQRINHELTGTALATTYIKYFRQFNFIQFPIFFSNSAIHHRIKSVQYMRWYECFISICKQDICDKQYKYRVHNNYQKKKKRFIQRQL